MRKILLYASLVLLTVLLARVDQARAPARSPSSEGCLACHGQVTDPSPAHPVAVFGCSPCHGGNRHSRDKSRAHHDMVLKPGGLDTIGQTCGSAHCHPEQAQRVRTSVMTTNAGILAALFRLWDLPGNGASGVSELPRDYYAKLCSGCHLRRARGGGEREFDNRGGGCSACHVTARAGKRNLFPDRLEHPPLSIRIPSANCLRCHNRSARIGPTYQGVLEGDGSFTPFQHGGPNTRRLSGNRDALSIPADVHFLAGMACIDCHTGLETMGDGQAHGSLKAQLEIRCGDCHEPVFGKDPVHIREAKRLAATHPDFPPLGTGPVAVAGKGSALYALRLVRPPSPSGDQGLALLYRKADGKPLEIPLHSPPKPHHALSGHERLACQACHSRFMPQCFGCHVVLDRAEEQQDHIQDRPTSGRWSESRSFTRFQNPPLGLANGTRIMPFSPCQVVVSVHDRKGRYRPGLSVGEAAMTSFDPHSTAKQSRTCLDCHLETKSLGQGSGFRPLRPEAAVRRTYDSASSGLGWAFGPDQMADANGTVLHEFPHGRDRPFSGAELRAIRSVAPCLPCHGEYGDPVWRSFEKSLQLIVRGRIPACAFNRLAPNKPGAGPQCVQ